MITALAAQPLVSAATVEESAGISRMTAKRLLARMQEMGLIREVTGSRRFRVWSAMGSGVTAQGGAGGKGRVVSDR